MTLLVLLDLSVAFDTVDPSILLTRLRSKLGLNRAALSWFFSFLSGRIQRISVQGVLSNVFHLRYGVPQGSYLRADVSKYRPEVYKSEKSKILKKIYKVALGKLLT